MNKMPRKKKVIESADIAEMVNVPSNGWPKINQGSHLTVKTYEDGKTELIWDDEALTRDVQNALTEYENSVKVNTVKTTKRKKKNEA
jgi:hypothetical protein